MTDPEEQIILNLNNSKIKTTDIAMIQFGYRNFSEYKILIDINNLASEFSNLRSGLTNKQDNKIK